jgi:zinc metalloprotease ZmpB
MSAGDSMPEWRLVPNDNNVGQRNVAPVPGGGTSGLTAEFDGLEFELKNPMPAAARMKVAATLPPLLVERGWRLDFVNRAAPRSPSSPARAGRSLMRLHPGEPFQASDVEDASDRTIIARGATAADNGHAAEPQSPDSKPDEIAA